jgi:WD40 repeat protein
MLPNARMQSKPLFFSLVRRMIATLINCVAKKASAHSGSVTSVAFSPDGTKIVSGSEDGAIKAWGSGAPRAQNRPSLAETDACWLVHQERWGC